MADGSDQIAKWMSLIERRLGHLETSPRAPHTAIQNGSIRWLDAAGEEDVAIETGAAGQGFMRVWNEDHTASVFAAESGVGTFPLPACAWQRQATLSSFDADGWPSISSGTYLPAWNTMLSITTPSVRTRFAGEVDGGSTADLRIRAAADSFVTPRAGHSVAGLVTVGEFTGLTGAIDIDELVAIPTTLWTPDADPVGTMVVMLAEARITAGVGSVVVKAAGPVYCRA